MWTRVATSSPWCPAPLPPCSPAPLQPCHPQLCHAPSPALATPARPEWPPLRPHVILCEATTSAPCGALVLSMVPQKPPRLPTTDLHSSRVPCSCTPLVYLTHALLSCTLLMHSSRVPYSCTPLGTPLLPSCPPLSQSHLCPAWPI